MFDEEFYNQYLSKNTIIKEGYAYAISIQWFNQFNSILSNPNEVDNKKIEMIKNEDICDLYHQIQTNLDGYSIPKQTSTFYSHIHRLRPGLYYGQDYDIVSIEVWNFLKLYYTADYEVVVLVTKIHPNLTNYFTCENLDQGVCICKEVFYIVLVIVEIQIMNNRLDAIKVPVCPWLNFSKFRTFITNIASLNHTEFNKLAYIYFNGKKIPFKTNKTLKDLGITKEMQIVISCHNLTAGDIEEEIETDQDDQKIEQNIYTKQEFLQIIEQNLNHQQTELLKFKSIQEIQKCLEQIDFKQI